MRWVKKEALEFATIFIGGKQNADMKNVRMSDDDFFVCCVNYERRHKITTKKAKKKAKKKVLPWELLTRECTR